MVATLTFLPFIVNSSISTLTSLDFLGLGMPPGSPSLGELLLQGKSNLSAPWIGLSAFVVTALMLSLLIFIGEAVRDAFDPRKTFCERGLNRFSTCASCRSRSRKAASAAPLSIRSPSGSKKVARWRWSGDFRLGQDRHRAGDRAPPAAAGGQLSERRDLLPWPRRAQNV